MFRFVSVLSMCIVIAIGELAGAQESLDSPGKEQLGAWADVFAGEWRSESKITFDWPGAKIGDSLIVHFTLRKTDDNMHYEGVWRGTINGELFESARAIYGWDPSRKCVRGVWFSARGGTGGAYITQIDDMRWLHTNYSTSPDGVEGSSTTVIELKDRNTHSSKTTNSVQGGKVRPDSSSVSTRQS